MSVSVDSILETTLFVLILAGLIACNITFNQGKLEQFKSAAKFLISVTGLLFLNSIYIIYKAKGTNTKIGTVIASLLLYSPLYIVGLLLFSKSMTAKTIDDVTSVILPSQIIGYSFISIYLGNRLMTFRSRYSEYKKLSQDE